MGSFMTGLYNISDSFLSCRSCPGDPFIEDNPCLGEAPSAGIWVLLGLKCSPFTLGETFTFYQIVERMLELKWAQEVRLAPMPPFS